MHIKRIKNDWYSARYTFKTRYGTIATATGYGSSFAMAMLECLKDYKIIISL